jgi:hypothetical protein
MFSSDLVINMWEQNIDIFIKIALQILNTGRSIELCKPLNNNLSESIESGPEMVPTFDVFLKYHSISAWHTISIM